MACEKKSSGFGSAHDLEMYRLCLETEDTKDTETTKDKTKAAQTANSKEVITAMNTAHQQTQAAMKAADAEEAAQIKAKIASMDKAFKERKAKEDPYSAQNILLKASQFFNSLGK